MSTKEIQSKPGNKCRKELPHNRRFNDFNFEIWVSVVHMNVGDVLRKSFVVLAGGFVKDEEQKIETGQKSGWKVDIVHWRYFGIISTV